MVMPIEAEAVLDTFLQSRSPESREKLVLQTVPLVYYLLGRMGVSKDKSNDYEDLAHQGLMGLIDAVDHFDPAFNTRFSTYASLRIRGKIVDHLRTSDWMTREARRRAHLIQKTMSALWTENLREPTEEEIAARIGTDVEFVQKGLIDLNRRLISLDLLVAEGGESGELYDGLNDETQIDPAKIYEEETQIAEMTSAIRGLPEREQMVLSLYYNEELTLKQIGKVLDLSESRVCQLHAHAITSLKEMMNCE